MLVLCFDVNLWSRNAVAVKEESFDNKSVASYRSTGFPTQNREDISYNIQQPSAPNPGKLRGKGAGGVAREKGKWMTVYFTAHGESYSTTR